MSNYLPEDWNPKKPVYAALMNEGWHCTDHAVNGRTMYQTWKKSESAEGQPEQKWYKLIQFRWDADEGWIVAFESESLMLKVDEDIL